MYSKAISWGPNSRSASSKMSATTLKELGRSRATAVCLGTNSRFNVASVTIPKEPVVPMKTCFQSTPTLFFLSPLVKSSKVPSLSPRTTFKPSVLARTSPYRMNLEPPVLVEIIPPTIGSAPKSMGKNNPCCSNLAFSSDNLTPAPTRTLRLTTSTSNNLLILSSDNNT